MRYMNDPVKETCLLLAYLIICPVFYPQVVRAQQLSQKAPATPKAMGGIGKAKLAEKPVEVLGGRLTVRTPQAAKNEARQKSIMSAPESEEHETRLVFDAGDERLVIMAQESFALASDHFEKDVKEWVAKWMGKYKIEPSPLTVKGIKAVAVIPLNDPDRTRSDDATFVEGIFIQSKDRTIQSLGIYVNAPAEKDLKGCKDMAHQILMSAAPGKKNLDLTTGERRLYVYSKDLEVSVTVPKNTAATKQVGVDFLVHRLIILGPLGAAEGSILIYVGGHPTYEPGAKKGATVVFGKKAEWHSLPQGDGLETLCDLPVPGNRHLKMHIIIQAHNDDQLKILRQAAESLKLVKAKGSG